MKGFSDKLVLLVVELHYGFLEVVNAAMNELSRLKDVPGYGLAPGVLPRINGQSHTRTEVVSLNKRHFESPTGCLDGNTSTRSASSNDQNVELGVYITST